MTKISLFTIAAFIIGGCGGMVFDYVFFSQMVNNPTWADNDFVKSLASRYQVIKNTEKIIVENSESIADIAARASTSVVFVEAVNDKGAVSTGNGVVVGSDGVVATTIAVVPDGSGTQYVKFADGHVYQVTDMYTDIYSGMVFLKTEAQNLSTISFANSDDAQSGKQLINIVQSRSDNGAHFSASGLVGNLYDTATQTPVSDHLQGVFDIDFAGVVSRNNVGSPVVDYQGNMVGLISSRFNEATQQDAFFAIAANDIYRSFETYLRAKSIGNGQKAPQPTLLGINYDLVNAIDAQIMKLSVDRGAIIHTPATYQETLLFNKTPAAKFGLRGGDVVIMVNKEEVTAKNNLSRLLHKYDRSQQIELTVSRGGNIVTVTIPPV